MSKSKMYYAIRLEGDKLGYFIGRDRFDLGMSCTLHLEHGTAQQVAEKVAQWHQEAITYKMEAVA